METGPAIGSSSNRMSWNGDRYFLMFPRRKSRLRQCLLAASVRDIAGLKAQAERRARRSKWNGAIDASRTSMAGTMPDRSDGPGLRGHLLRHEASGCAQRNQSPLQRSSIGQLLSD